MRRGAAAAGALIIAVSASAGARGATRTPRAVTVLSVNTRTNVKPLHPRSVLPARSGVYLHSSKAGAVTPTPKVYLVFWGKQWSSDPARARPALVAFFTHLFGPAEKWGLNLDQYCEGLPAHTVNCGSLGTHVVHPSSSPLAGSWNDAASPAPSVATISQIAGEAANAAAHFGNTAQAKNANAIYVIASAHGTHPDRFPSDGYCGWHSIVTTSAGTLGYTSLPYVPDVGPGGCTTLSPAGLLDGYFSTESHEYAESVTDLWLGRGWFDASNEEIADRCVDFDARETLGGVKYDVQGVWSNVTMSCKTS